MSWLPSEAAVWAWLGFLLALVIVHEFGHAVATWLVGGRVEGLVIHRGWMVGTRVHVEGLSVPRIAVTLAAALGGDVLVWSAASLAWPTHILTWSLLLGAHWLPNVVPWPGIPNDGRRLWRLWHTGRAEL